jgi:hypothetical protein
MAHIDWKPAFLAALAQVPVVDRACRAVGVSRGTVYKARKADATFAAAWDDALEDGVDCAEEEAFTRAVDGFEEPVIHAGQLMFRTRAVADADGNVRFEPVLDTNGQPVPLTIRKYSDQLLALILKGRRKALYSERTEITGVDAGPVHMGEIDRATRVGQLLAAAQARLGDQA